MHSSPEPTVRVWNKIQRSAECPQINAGCLNDLKLDHLWVIYPGRHRYPVDDKITVLPIGSIHEVAWTWWKYRKKDRVRISSDDNGPADNVKGQASAFILLIVDRILPFFQKNNVLRIISIVVNPSRLWPSLWLWLYLDSAPTLSAWSVSFAFPQMPWSFQFVW